jgi:hypothetical protein
LQTRRRLQFASLYGCGGGLGPQTLEERRAIEPQFVSIRTAWPDLFVGLARVMNESDIERLLHLRVALAMPLREAEERLVARVVGESLCEFVARRQIDAELAEPIPELGPVLRRRGSVPHSRRRSTRFHRRARRARFRLARRLEIRVIAITEKEKNERVILHLESDLESRGEPAALHCHSPRNLEWLPGMDPALDVVDAAFAAEAVKVAELTRIRCCPRTRRRQRGPRVRSRIDES